MRQVYLVPNILTAFSLACGLFVIFKVNMVEPGAGTFHLLNTSALLLLVAAFADLLDGAVARAIHAESEFGFMFDSLADAVSFGVAPSVLFLKSLSLEQGTGLSFFAVVGAMLFSICGVLRLVRFNVKASEAKKAAALGVPSNKHFTGLPIPAGALAAVSATLFLFSPFGEKMIPIHEDTRAIVLTCLMIIIGYFMVSRWKFPSSKALHFRVPSFQLVFVTVIIAIFFLYGILYYFPIMLAVASWFYLIIGWTLSIIRLIAGKKSKTLEDYEPEEEEEEN
ncbi:MAG: CDP-alcohol phosphatidyltransferase family protein [Rhabdochlamydiaceae bacterium]|nr:CDP-alcohol phosphatidyltransferase family protein [Rhabdochlamydiaceae bacterium]